MRELRNALSRLALIFIKNNFLKLILLVFCSVWGSVIRRPCVFLVSLSSPCFYYLPFASFSICDRVGPNTRPSSRVSPDALWCAPDFFLLPQSGQTRSISNSLVFRLNFSGYEKVRAPRWKVPDVGSSSLLEASKQGHVDIILFYGFAIAIILGACSFL